MDSEEEQNLHDQEWRGHVPAPGDVVYPIIDQEQFAEEIGYKPDVDDDEDVATPVEWDHENS